VHQGTHAVVGLAIGTAHQTRAGTVGGPVASEALGLTALPNGQASLTSPTSDVVACCII